MKSYNFKESNTVFAKNQPPYKPLPAFFDNENGIVVTCYKLSFLERFYVLFSGKVWFGQMTFGNPLQPQKPTVFKNELLIII